MNRSDIRAVLINEFDELVSRVYPGVPIFYENARSIDRPSLPDMVMYVVVDFLSSGQINIGERPDTRYSGSLDVTILVKETRGVKQVLEVADTLEDHFSYKTVKGVHLGVPDLERIRAPDGWSGKTLTIPFFADSNS